ncbi:head-tail connector protein [Mitsuokella multacida]|uniref:head-tail connector protein n=1 Tax=Mitsuokella multacida TaxID=52226 RepID=UPI002665BB27|nr:head-tail connector protein [Mitsuokella multacida]
MAITVEDIKLYLRIDNDAEDNMLQQMIGRADAYLDGAVSNFAKCCKTDSFDKKADIVRMAIVSEMYNNRDCQEDKHQAFPYFIRSAITQLQCYAEGGGDA